MAVEEGVVEEQPRDVGEEVGGGDPRGRERAAAEQRADLGGGLAGSDRPVAQRAEKLGDPVHQLVPQPAELVGRFGMDERQFVACEPGVHGLSSTSWSW